MQNTSHLFVKVVLSLVTVGSLVVTVAGPVGATGAGASAQTATAGPAQTATTGRAATPSGQPSCQPSVSPHLPACRAMKHDLATYSRGLARFTARVNRMKAHAAKVQASGHVKAAQARQQVVTKFEAKLARRRAAHAKVAAAFSRRDAKFGVKC